MERFFFFWFFFPVLCSSVESTQWPGRKTVSLESERGRERVDETHFTDEIFTAEEAHSWTETLPCLRSVPFFFLTWHRATCFPLCGPIYAISGGEVITWGWRGMFFTLSALCQPQSWKSSYFLVSWLCLPRQTCLAQAEKRNATVRTVRLWSAPCCHLCNYPRVPTRDICQVCWSFSARRCFILPKPEKIWPKI